MKQTTTLLLSCMAGLLAIRNGVKNERINRRKCFTDREPVPNGRVRDDQSRKRNIQNGREN